MTHSAHIRYMILAGVAALAGLWILGVPLDRALPFAFFLACPLMMLFMMRGMGHGGHRGGPSGGPAEATSQDPERNSTPLASDASTRTAPADEIALIDRQYRT